MRPHIFIAVMLAWMAGAAWDTSPLTGVVFLVVAAILAKGQ